MARPVPAALLSVVLALLAAPVGAGPGLPDAGDDASARATLDEVFPDRAARLRVIAVDGAAGHLRVLQRLSAARPRWRLAATVERDPGEAWADHVRAYVQGRVAPSLDLAVGHLRPGFGQGLLFGRGISVGVPAPRARLETANLGTRSAAERHAVTGVAVRQRGAAGSVAVVAGVLPWDARLDSAATAVSLPEDGDHTGSGAAVRQRLHGTVLGLRGTVVEGSVRLGVTGQRLAFDRRVDLRRPETGYAFHGRGQRALGVDLVAGGRHRRAYVAVARLGGRSAAVAGITGARAAGLRVELLVRCYGAGVFAPLGAAAGAMDDEHGATATLRWHRWRGWLDLTRRPAGRWRHPVPAWRRRAGLSWDGQSWPGLRLRAVAQSSRGTSWRTVGAALEATERARLQATWSRRSVKKTTGEPARETVRATVRADGVRYGWHARGRAADGAGDGDLDQAGWALSGVIVLRHRRLAVDLQVSLFRTDGYGARLYEAERELPGAVSIRPLYGRGGRGVIVLGGHLGTLRLSARWRLEARDGELRHTVGVQLDFVDSREGPG